MSKGNGFLQLRRGIWEHVRDGRMSTTEALAFIYICSEADTRTGIWKGSAKSLSGELGISERTARDVLEKMGHGDYIRRFAVPGSHSCYPILVHKFSITQGEHYGEHLNALASTSPADLAYFPREQSVGQDGGHGAAQRRSKKENRESRKPYLASLEARDITSLLREKILGNNPTSRISETQLAKWNMEADLMLQRDGRKVADIRANIEWSQQDAFWRTNILSMGKLRKNFDQITIKRQGRQESTRINGSAVPNGRAPHIPTAADCRPEH